MKQVFKTQKEGLIYFKKMYSQLDKNSFLKEATYEIENLFGCDLITANNRAHQLYKIFSK